MLLDPLMPEHKQATNSVWQATADALHPAPLNGDARAEVCVIGAGITGMTTAYLLAREGMHVVVIDRDTVGSGDTGRTTAHLSNELDDRYTEIERVHGTAGARLACESHGAAISTIESIVGREDIACDFTRLDGYLFLTPEDSGDLLEQEYEAALRAGAPVERAERAPLAAYDTGPCLRFTQQGQLHPLAYLRGLHTALARYGGRVFSETTAEDVSADCVHTNRGRISADAVVVTTNVPIHLRFSIHPKQAPYRTYAIGMRVPRGSVARALYWDTADPYHYVRLCHGHDNGDGEDILIVGGEDHKTGQRDDHVLPFDNLENWARVRFPAATDVGFRWSGQVMETFDGLAFIGRDTGGVYFATGDSGMGMTHGTIAAMIFRDQISGAPNPWADLYNPRRISLKGISEVVHENVNVAVQYSGWITPSDVRSIDDIPPGTGAVVRRGFQKLAVYRDPHGVVHKRSAACTHLGCIVAWNQTEQTWDCPCHGSRFDAYGCVLSGPAVSDLNAKEEDLEPSGEPHSG